LCGYVPARNEDRFATTEERKWLTRRADYRASAKHKWLTGKTAMDIDFVENFNARRTFGKAMEVVQTANRLEKNATKKPDIFAKEFIPSWLPQPAQTLSEPVVKKSETGNLTDIPVENTLTPPNPAANPAPVAKKEMGKKTVSSSTTVSTPTAQITETQNKTNTLMLKIFMPKNI
ncbi:13268_t:CDS:2, partial [Ambispora leptoticha]